MRDDNTCACLPKCEMFLKTVVIHQDKTGEETSATNGTANGEANGEASEIEDLTGRVTKWRIENSWGEERNHKGYLVMTNDWFHEFVFEIVVDKKFCSQEVLDVFKLEPKVLPAWDPMGALATRNN